MTNNGIYRQVVLCQYYSFDIGLSDKELSGRVFQSLEDNRNIWLARFTGSSLKDETGQIDDETLLKSLYRFQNKYLYPEFRVLLKSSHFQLPSFSIKVFDFDIAVEVVLNCHKSGVGTLMFLFASIPHCSGRNLKALTSIHSTSVPIHYSVHLRDALEKSQLSTPSESSIDDMVVIYLKLLHPDERLVQQNSISLQSKKRNILSESRVNMYQFISIEGVGKDEVSVVEYVQRNRTELIDAAEAYSKYCLPQYSVVASRKEEALVGCFPADSSERKHMVYQMNGMRLLTVSAISAHPEIYQHEGRSWYYSYLGIIELVLCQFQAIYLLHGELQDNLNNNKEDLLEMQERAYESLHEFQNARIIEHPRARSFMKRLTEYMQIEDYYRVVKERVDLANRIIIERHNDKEKRRATHLQLLGVLLTLLLSLQFADNFFEKILRPFCVACGWVPAADDYLVKIVIWMSVVIVATAVFLLMRKRQG